MSSTFDKAIDAEAIALGVSSHDLRIMHANWRAGKSAPSPTARVAFNHFEAHPEQFGTVGSAPVPAARKTTELDPFEKNVQPPPQGRIR